MAAVKTILWSNKLDTKCVAENEALFNTMLPPASPAVRVKPARVAVTWVSVSAEISPSRDTPYPALKLMLPEVILADRSSARSARTSTLVLSSVCTTPPKVMSRPEVIEITGSASAPTCVDKI
ncbi:hypothetical protein MCEMAEM4_03378 [Burkholderiaceae bacterium]